MERVGNDWRLAVRLERQFDLLVHLFSSFRNSESKNSKLRLI
jgi:hypothetical protein